MKLKYIDVAIHDDAIDTLYDAINESINRAAVNKGGDKKEAEKTHYVITKLCEMAILAERLAAINAILKEIKPCGNPHTNEIIQLKNHERRYFYSKNKDSYCLHQNARSRDDGSDDIYIVNNQTNEIHDFINLNAAALWLRTNNITSKLLNRG